MTAKWHEKREARRLERAERFVALIAESAPSGGWVFAPKRQIGAALGCSLNAVSGTIATLIEDRRIERGYHFEQGVMLGLKVRLLAAPADVGAQ